MRYDDINHVHALSIPNARARDVERAKHVLLYIASRDGKGRGCWASQETMAKELPMPLRAVERAISFLKKRNLITVTRRAHKSSIIKLNRQASADSPVPPSPGGSLESTDPSSAGGSPKASKPPMGSSQSAIQAADKHHEHAGRSRRAALPEGEARRSRRAGVEALDPELGSNLDNPALVTFEEEPTDLQAATQVGAAFNEIPMLGSSIKQKPKGAELVTPGSPCHLDGGSPGAPSAAAHQASSPAQQAQDTKQRPPPSAPIGRKPVLPQIEDQELYNRLTKRLPR